MIMMKFRDFFDLRLFTDAELFAEGVIEDLEAHQPLDGRWKEMPTAYGQSVYVFNVAGEEGCSSTDPCYAVKFYGNQYGAASISFSREGTHEDTNRMNHKDVIRGVLKAIIKYVKDTNPIGLDWTAVTKSKRNDRTGDFVNPNAREIIYRGWAIRHLFPQKYVGGIKFPGHEDDNLWVRRDVYDKVFVPHGLPSIPEDISDDSPSGAKIKIVELLSKQVEETLGKLTPDEQAAKKTIIKNAFSAAAQKEYHAKREEEKRKREEQERIKKEMLDAAMSSPNHNPEGLVDGDTVFVQSLADTNLRPDLAEMRGRIVDFHFGDAGGEIHNNPQKDRLWATVKFARDDDDNYFSGESHTIIVGNLRKEGPEHIEQRTQRRRERTEAMRRDPSFNPNGIEEGDDVITYLENSPGSTHNGLFGKIKEIFLHSDRRSLMVNVEWDEKAKEVLDHQSHRAVHISNFLKATPENKELVLGAKRKYEIEQQVQANQQRQQRQQQRQQQYQGGDESTPENIINHPLNPQHLKVGDHVIVGGNDWRNPGRRGVIVSINTNTWNPDSINATVKFHGSNARRPTNFWSLDALQRDTSPESQQRITRQQQQMARQQRIASAVGGLNIGDTVTVGQGRNRGKTGTILSFRASGQNVSAVIASRDGNFTSDIRYIVNPQAPQAESLSFFRYFRVRNQDTICEQLPAF